MNILKTISITTVAAAAVLLTYNKASAATLYVGSGETHKTIQAAVNAATYGDVIKVHSGTYHETVTVGKSNLTIEAADPKNPPELDGSDLNFANTSHSWTNVQGKIYKTAYNLPFPHVTPSGFTPSSYGPASGKGTGRHGDPLMTLYEDEVWLRGYEGMNYNELSYPYNKLEDLDPALDIKSNSADHEIRIPGRFMYDNSANQLYVWSAKGDNPANHKYHIPVLKNLMIINSPNVTLRNLVMKHTYYYAVSIGSSGDGAKIENCFIVNTGPWGIYANNAENVKILDNFVQLNGFYERQDYISVRFNILKGMLVRLTGYALARNCEIAGNVVTGTYGVTVLGQDCKMHDNIVSKSQSILVSPSAVDDVVPPGYIHDVSVYNNILHHSGFSAFDNYTARPADEIYYRGPVWFFRNVIYAVENLNKDGCQEGFCDPTPDTFIYNNTFALGGRVAHHPYDYPVMKSTVYRNNVFHLRYTYMEMYWGYSDNDSSKGWSYFPFLNGPDSDYNLYWRNVAHPPQTQIARFRLTGETQSYKEGEFDLMRQQTGLDPHGFESDPMFKNKSTLDTANVLNVNYDQISGMNYKDIITQGYNNLYSQKFNALYNYFALSSASPAINKGQAIPSGWPDTGAVKDGKPDMGAIEYGGSIPVDTTAPSAATNLTVR